MSKILHAIILIYRSNYNDTRPVNQLPAEVLCHIFREIQSTSYVGRQMQAAVRLQAVCRRWRNIIFEDASLWTVIDLRPKSVQLALQCLTRSKGAPLTLRFPPDKDPQRYLRLCRPFFNVLPHHASRIRELVIAQITIHKRLDFAAPNLESMLVISTPNPTTETKVLPTLFKGKFPSLKTLAITHCSSWPNSDFSNLSSISLACLVWETIESMTPLYGMLTRCPTLTSLQFDMCFPTFDITEDTSSALIDLPCLEILGMKDCLLQILLSHLRIHTSTQLRIEGNAAHWQAMDEPPISVTRLDVSAPLPDNISNLHCVRDIQRLVIAQHEDWTMEMCGYIGSRVSFHIMGEEIRSISPVKYVLVSLLGLLRFGAFYQLTKLEFAFLPEYLAMSAQLWEEVLRRCPSVRVIHMWDIPKSLFAALLAVGDDGETLCPHLEEIRGELVQDEAGAEDELIRLAKTRHGRNRPIQRFVYEGHALDKEVLESLGKFVETITHSISDPDEVFVIFR